MMGRSHLIIGVSTTLLVAHATGFVQPHTLGGIGLSGTGSLLVAGLAAAAGSWMPDIDSSRSSIAYRTGTGHKRGCLRLDNLLFDSLRRLLGGHRALTHSLWAILAVGFVFGLQPIPSLPGWPGLTPWADIGTAFTIGYVLHIAADFLTQEGIRFFWPIQHREVHILPRGLSFPTGSIREYIVLVLIGLAIAGIWLRT